MNKLIVYTYAKCSTCRNATKWLRESGIEFTERPIRETSPTITELTQMLTHQDGALRKLFNTSGGDYRALQLGEKLPSMAIADALQLLESNGNLVKRPFLLAENVGLVGFKVDQWAEALG